jgi:hypothetical protein
MSNTYTTLADLVKLNDQNARDLGVTDLLNRAPVLKALHATTASNGTLHHYIKQTAAPVVGFRAVNTGKDNGASGYTEVDITLKNLDASWLEDIAIVNNYRGGPAAFAERENNNSLQQGFFVFEQQVFYGTGTGGSSVGFAGLSDNSLFNGLSGNTGTTVVNAGGTTAATASSIWLLRSTPDELNVTVVIGKDGQITIGETVISVKADDTTATKSFGVYYTPIQAYGGLQIGSVNSAVRIANVTADSGKGATDNLIATGIAQFPAYAPPTLCVMTRRSWAQLRASRTATNETGAPAPFPQDSNGIQIIVTDALVNTEALIS